MLLILRDIMSKFMYSGSYTPEGVKGLLKEGGTERRDETKRIVESLGGELELSLIHISEPTRPY